MEKILVAIDFSPVSEKVAEKAHKLAKSMNAKVCLFHVMREISYYAPHFPPFVGYEGYSGMITGDLELVSEMHNITEDFLEKLVKHLKDPSIETHLAEGDTAYAILEYAEEWEADLIVMGTHSHSVLEKLLMGTVASTVLEKTQVPVLLIPVKQ